MKLRLTIDAPNQNAHPDKLADVEVLFTEGPLQGTLLSGFTIWRSKKTGEPQNVSLPSRTYMSGSIKRSYTLFRDQINTPEAKDLPTEKVKQLILSAYQHLQKTGQAKEGVWFADIGVITTDMTLTPAPSIADPTATTDEAFTKAAAALL